MILLVWFLLFLKLKGISCQSPPRAVETSYHQAAKSGTPVTLRCPVEVDRTPTSLVFFDWTKDGSSIESKGDPRLRVLRNGSLKLKMVYEDDAGEYVCRAINGFGSVEVVVTLDIFNKVELAKSEVMPALDENQYPEPHGILPRGEGVPRFNPPKRSEYSEFHRPMGSSITFSCEANGQTPLRVAWWKNGVILTRKDFSVGRIIRSWYLKLDYLKKEDSGNYTCKVSNDAGYISATFSLDVSSPIDEKPEITGVDPLNATVKYGGSASLLCNVSSRYPITIRWLKLVENPLSSTVSVDKIFKIENEFYRVLNTSNIADIRNYYKAGNLIIHNVTDRDVGKYACLAANIKGYHIRAAYISIIQSDEYIEIEAPQSSFPALILIVAAVIVLGFGLVIILSVLLNRVRSRDTAMDKRHQIRQLSDSESHCLNNPLSGKTEETISVTRSLTIDEEKIIHPTTFTTSVHKHFHYDH